MDSELPKADRGSQWRAVVGAFVTLFAWMGVLKALAVLLPTLQVQFDSQTWLVGWMIAIFNSVVEIAGPLACPLRKWVGVRAVVMVSGVVIGLAFIVSACVSSLGAMTIILAGIAAPALGVCNIATREMIGMLSLEMTTAYGIATVGSSLSFVFFAPFTQFFLDTYGLRGTMVSIGAILFNVTVSGALLRNPRQEQSTRCNYETIKSEETTPVCSRTVLALLNAEVFAYPSYWLILVLYICMSMSNASWIVYFAANTSVSKGFSLADAAAFVATFGVGKLVGRFVIAAFPTFCTVFRTYALMGVAFGVSSLCLVADIWLMTYELIMANTFIYGFANAWAYTLIDVITRDVFGTDRLGSTLGWIGAKWGVVCALSLYFPGLIYDLQGSYTLAFIIMSIINGLGLPALMALYCSTKQAN